MKKSKKRIRVEVDFGLYLGLAIGYVKSSRNHTFAFVLPFMVIELIYKKKAINHHYL